jgi:hypothetical protein
VQDDSGVYQHFSGVLTPDGRRVRFPQTVPRGAQDGFMVTTAEEEVVLGPSGEIRFHAVRHPHSHGGGRRFAYSRCLPARPHSPWFDRRREPADDSTATGLPAFACDGRRPCTMRRSGFSSPARPHVTWNADSPGQLEPRSSRLIAVGDSFAVERQRRLAPLVTRRERVGGPERR